MGFQTISYKVPFFYGWVIVAASGLAMFGSGTLTPQIFSLFITPMSEEFGWSRSLTSGAFAIGTLCGVASAPVFGRLVDRHGARFILAGGAVVTGGAAIAIGATETVAMFYIAMTVGRMVQQGGTVLAGPTAVANWFVRRRALAMAILLMHERIGLAVLPIATWIVVGVTGDWRTGWYVLGATSLIVGVLPPLLFVQRRPEDLGLQPDGIQPRQIGEAGGFSKESLSEEPRWSAREAMNTRAFWLVAMASFVFVTLNTGIVVHQIAYFIDRGISPTSAALVVVIGALGMGVGLPFWAYVADRISPRIVLAMAMALASMLLPLLAVTSYAWMAYLYSALAGLAFGSVGVLVPILLASYFGRYSLGTISGVTRPFHAMGNAIGPVIAGGLFDATGTYMWAFGPMAILCLVMAILVTQARRPTH